MGVPWTPSHFPCSLPCPQPHCPTRGLSSQVPVEGSGGPGVVELEGWVEEGEKGSGFGLNQFVGQAGTQSCGLGKRVWLLFIH